MIEKWISSFGSDVQKFQLQEAEEAYQSAKNKIYSCAVDYQLEVQPYHFSLFHFSSRTLCTQAEKLRKLKGENEDARYRDEKALMLYKEFLMRREVGLANILICSY